MPDPKLKDVLQMRAALKAYCDKAGSQKKAANDLKVFQSHISEMLSGRRDISEKVAAKLGYRRVFMYEKTS